MLETIIFTIIGLVLFSLLFYNLVFLRKPKRNIPLGENIVSPADGKVIRIINFDRKNLKFNKGKFGNVNVFTKDTIKKGFVIPIALNLFNVHYQRAPVSGKIINVKYTRGRFLNAISRKTRFSALFENEKNEILIECEDGSRVKVIQIAGFLARRIECFVKKNQQIKKGEIIGVIKLGSQVCLVVPECDIKISENNYVRDGETIIALVNKKTSKGKK